MCIVFKKRTLQLNFWKQLDNPYKKSKQKTGNEKKRKLKKQNTTMEKENSLILFSLTLFLISIVLQLRF